MAASISDLAGPTEPDGGPHNSPAQQRPHLYAMSLACAADLSDEASFFVGGGASSDASCGSFGAAGPHFTVHERRTVVQFVFGSAACQREFLGMDLGAGQQVCEFSFCGPGPMGSGGPREAPQGYVSGFRGLPGPSRKPPGPTAKQTKKPMSQTVSIDQSRRS